MPDHLEQIPALILVGGLGTRLRPLLPDHQKVMAPVAGRPFLFRLLDQLANAGLTHVVLCTGYKADQVAETVGSDYRGLSVTYSREPEALGTAGALRRALPDTPCPTLLAMNGDSYCEVNLCALWESHRRSRANATLVVTQVHHTRAGGRLVFDGQGAILSFVEKGTSTESGWMNAGIYMLERPVLEAVPTGRPVSIEREVFPAWVGRGLHAFATTGKFLDIGTPESYTSAQQVIP
jgi:NDP-sugar pyrophosphorylase family protein